MSEILIFRNQPEEAYLANNPIVFELRSIIRDLIHYDIVIAGKIIFSGSAMPAGTSEFDADIQVSEIISSYMQTSEIDNMLSLICSVTNSFINITINFSQGEETLNFTGKVYPGGIGKKMMRYLKHMTTNIFANKLINTEKQFMLTTRTAGRHISIKENELYPLLFIATNKAYTAVTEYGNVFVFPAMTPGELYAFNPEVLRRTSFLTYGKLPSFLGILVDGKFVFDIVILKSDRTPDKLRVRFRNSFAAFEVIEISGKATSKTTVTDSSFMRFDSTTYDYTEENNRLSIRDSISAESGYKSLDEFMFIRDMLQSDKQILIDALGNEYNVRVSSDDFSYDILPREPGSIRLNIKVTETDTNYSPEIDESHPEFNFGEAIWETGITNGYGFLYYNSLLNTI